MANQLKAVVNKLTAVKYQIIELEIRKERLTDAELEKLAKLEDRFETLEIQLHAIKHDRSEV
jgi:hypothetical protein